MGGSSESDFSSAIARIAVAQICQSVGYGAAETFVLDTLSDVAALYLKTIARTAAASSNSCGRTQSNLFDIVFALEDLASVQGFPGASSSSLSSTIQNPLISSSLLKEIRKFVLYTDEIPFAQPLPRKILPTVRRCASHHNEKGNYLHGVNLGHVPRWLPHMPEIGGNEEGEGMKEEESTRRDFDGEGKEGRNWNGKGFELPEKRGKVKFEMVVKGGWGVEIGKRVLCHSLGRGRDGLGVEGDGKKKKVA